MGCRKKWQNDNFILQNEEVFIMKPRQKPKIDLMQRRGLVKRGLWRKPQILAVEKQPKKGVLYQAAGLVGWGVQKAENARRMLKGQARRVMFEPEFVRKLRVVNVAGEQLQISPSGYLPYVRRVRFSEKLSPKMKAFLARKGKLLSAMPFLVGCGAGVLSLGEKYIIIPKRPMTVGVHPGKFHWVAGMADYYRYAKGKKHELPHETAAREAAEEVGGKFETMPTWFTAEKVAKEIGSAKAKIQFLGQGLKPVQADKAPALILLQDLNINMFEISYAVDIKMQNPDEFIERNFQKVSEFSNKNLKGGLFEFRKDAPVADKWEMSQAAIFPRTSKSIFYFLKANRGKVTEAARFGLLAYAAELRKIGK